MDVRQHSAPPMPDPAAPPSGIAEVAHDSDAVATRDAGSEAQTQLELMQRRLGEFEKQGRRMQRLAAMGTMSAMLAHEFRNMLTPMVSYADYALEHPEPGLMKTALETTLKHARTLATMCERIMDMAADVSAAGASVDIRSVLDDALMCLGRGLDRDAIELHTTIPPGLCVRMPALELQQVLFNLIMNARQAMLDRPGVLSISASPADGGRVRLTIADTGAGIRSEDLPRIFDPFFTTKRRGEEPDRRGLGLGLTICRQIVDEAGGAIRVTSRWGEGTTFEIELPAA